MMSHTRSLHFLILIAMLLIGGVTVKPAAAQSENDLRRENERLSAQLRETTRELEAARARITELEQQVSRLERALAAARGSDERPQPASPDDEVTIDESEPTASPRALLRALQEEYREAMEEVEVGRAGDRERANYMRALHRWQAAMTRKHRAAVQWHVRIEGETLTRSGYDLRLRAVDPVTHAQLGNAFGVSLSRNLARRYESLRDRGQADIMVLRGTLVPRIAINPDRREAGAFDNPPLIGPFAEFHINIEPRSLTAAADEE